MTSYSGALKKKKNFPRTANRTISVVLPIETSPTAALIKKLGV
jgi:hypothetical protein